MKCDHCRIMVAKRIKALRMGHGYSVFKVAAFCNIAPQTYYGYESGERLPNQYVIDQLCDLYKVSKEFLLSGDGKDPITETEPVIHAHWIRTNNGKWRCSSCRGRHDYPMRYCGECGARMNERKDDRG